MQKVASETLGAGVAVIACATTGGTLDHHFVPGILSVVVGVIQGGIYETVAGIGSVECILEYFQGVRVT